MSVSLMYLFKKRKRKMKDLDLWIKISSPDSESNSTQGPPDQGEEDFENKSEEESITQEYRVQIKLTI